MLADTMRAMNIEAAKRLKEAARRAGYRSAAAFARAIGATEPTVRSHFNGNRSFDRADAKRYAAKINQAMPPGERPISAQWLLDGDEADVPPAPSAFLTQDQQSPAAGSDLERALLEKTILDVRAVFAAAGISDTELESKAIAKLFQERLAKAGR